MRTTQDDARENKQIEIFGAIATKGRSNKYIPDGHIQVNKKTFHIDFKTSDINKKQVSTARNVTLKKIEEWKEVIFIISQYEKQENGFRFTGEHYALGAKQMQEWYDKQVNKILHGGKTYAGIRDWEAVRDIALDANKDLKPLLEKLDNNFAKKGCGLNDPKISWGYVEKNGIKIDGNLKKEVRNVLPSL